MSNLFITIFHPQTSSWYFRHGSKLLTSTNIVTNINPVRTKYYSNRHREEKWRELRSKKVFKIELPNFNNEKADLFDTSAFRSRQKEKGIAPPLIWNERPIFESNTMSLIDPYTINDVDQNSIGAKVTKSVKSLPSVATDLWKSRRGKNHILQYEGDDFSVKEFAQQALDIYIKAHELLASKDKENIFKYVTEYCYPVMSNGIEQGTLIWKYIGDIKAPEVIRVRTADVGIKSNKYAQITVKFHCKQIMALFDRHGRLKSGSPTDVREVFDIIVFEKNLADEFGYWRMHAKIKKVEDPNLKKIEGH